VSLSYSDSLEDSLSRPGDIELRCTLTKISTNTLAYFAKEKEIFYRGHLADEAFRAVGVLFALLFRETTLLESML
jgi:hypothetical protein